MLSSEQKSKLDVLNIQPVKGIKGYSTFTPEEAAKLRAFYYTEGVTYGAMARHLGVPQSTLQSVMNRRHKFTRQEWVRLSERDAQKVEAVREAYRRREPLTSIAAKHGIPYATAKRLVKDLVAQYGQKPRLSAEKWESIRRDYINGMSYVEMGRKYNRTKSSFYRIIADLIPKHGRK